MKNAQNANQIFLALMFFASLAVSATFVVSAQDDWRKSYKVGDKVQFSISGKEEDFQTCTVAENSLNAPLRVKCEAFKQWKADTYSVSSKDNIRPAKKKGLFGKLSDSASKLGSKIENANSNRKQSTNTNSNTAANTKNTDSSRASSDAALNRNDNANSAARPTGGNAPADLPGTYWSLLSMTEKNEPIKDDNAPPDVELCKTGKWGMLHYGGAREAGTYRLAGGRIVLKMEDGSAFGDFRVTRKGNMMEWDDGKYLLRLKYIGTTNCTN